jgi:hypothetical protein
METEVSEIGLLLLLCGSKLFEMTLGDSHTEGSFGRVISPYLHRTTQHRTMRINIHVLSGI